MACAVTGVTVTLLGSPMARADDASFVSETQALGFQQASDNLISTARSACYFLSRDRDPGQITKRVMRYHNVELDPAQRFLVLSVIEYCPQFRERIGV
jgi:hypothetical protein